MNFIERVFTAIEILANIDAERKRRLTNLFTFFTTMLLISLLTNVLLHYFRIGESDYSFISLTFILTIVSTISVAFTQSIAWLMTRTSRNRKKNESDYLAESYAGNLDIRASVTSLALTVLGGVHWYFTKSGSGFILLLSCSVILITFSFLTKYRAQRGYLGTNASEVADLISFIDEKTKGGSPPSSTRVSRGEKDLAAAALRPEGGSIEGARS